MERTDRESRVTTTQLSLDILEVVLRHNGARLPDVVDELDVAKSTAHKHLTTLRDNGYLLKSGDTYRIGLKFLNFGEHARTRWPGFPLIEEAVAELTERTDEECDFVAPDGGRIITIAESYHKWVKYGGEGRNESSKEYRAHTGSYYYMHATGSGVAILAAYPRERIEEIIEQWGLPARTEYTVTTREELYEMLERVRERGYAVDDQGYTEGMRSVGRAVHGPDGDVIGAAREEVAAIDDAMEMAELRDRGTRLRSVCTDLIRDLEATLENDLETLSDVNVPEDYYERPDAADHDFVSEVTAASTLEAYRSAWMAAAADLTDALATIDRKARVASMYAEIEEHIESALRREGEVTGEDLPVKRDHEQFLGLYARTHDVEFDPSVPELSTPGSGERYTVTARVSFEGGGEERSATVELEGPDYDAAETITTYLADVVEFEDVPYGEYTAAAIPEASGNESAERSIAVEGDVTVDLEMADVSLRDRLCSGYDHGTIQTYLEELDDRFADTFESEGHLTSRTEFPIADEYVPCLLATWAGETGHDVTEVDDQVLVYDADTVTEELRMVAQHNLEAGGSMDYETLRERFLSAPVPDEAVRDAATSIESLTADDDHLRKQET